MKQAPTRGHRQLRKGRHSIPGAYYYLRLTTLNKKPLLANPKIADIIFQAFDWLETKERLRWFCVVVMPDHIHAVIQLGSQQHCPGLYNPSKATQRNRLMLVWDVAVRFGKLLTMNTVFGRKNH